MRPLHPKPICFINGYDVVDFVACHLMPSLHHIPYVSGIVQNLVYGSGRPIDDTAFLYGLWIEALHSMLPFVLIGAGNTQSNQFFCDC